MKHELTEKENAKEVQWQRRVERRRFRNEGDDLFVPRPTFQEWDWHPTGQLSFELEHIYIWSGSSPRRSFRDAKIQRLENMASDISVGIAVLAAVKTEQRLRREAEQRRRDEARRLRDEARRDAHVEERRIQALETILGEMERAERLRRLLRAVRDESGGSDSGRLGEFMRWSENYLAMRTSRLTAEGLTRQFQEQRLFGEDDDHAFRAAVSLY